MRDEANFAGGRVLSARRRNRLKLMADGRLRRIREWRDRRSNVTQWLIAIGLTLVIAQLINPLTRQLPFNLGVGLTLTILVGSSAMVAFYSWRKRRDTHTGHH